MKSVPTSCSTRTRRPTSSTRLVESTVARFHAETAGIPDAYLRVIIGTDQQPAIEALVARGARREAEFVRTRKPLEREDVVGTGCRSQPRADGIELAGARRPRSGRTGAAPAVRHVPRALREHVEVSGGVSIITSTAVRSHRISASPPSTRPAMVVGYVLGSTFSAGAAPDDERSAHTDYIGVRSDQRKRGIGELLLRKIWLAALRRGFTVASLGTDIDNRSKAHLLYRRLGYAVRAEPVRLPDRRSEEARLMSDDANVPAAAHGLRRRTVVPVRSDVRVHRRAQRRHGNATASSRTSRCAG